MTPAVFLDRDGTMIEDAGYLSRREDLRWYPWTADAIRLLNRAGLLVFVVTNQGGIGLGFYPEQFVLDTHAYMDQWLQASGARVDGWFFCPHHPHAIVAGLDQICECRKPGRGMVDQACRQAPVDLARSFVVGDKIGDLRLAAAIGATGILVKTGHGEHTLQREPDAARRAIVADDLMSATAEILRRATSLTRSP